MTRRVLARTAVVVAMLFAGCSDDDEPEAAPDERAEDAVDDDNGGDVDAPHGDVLEAYAITYRVEEPADDDPRETTATLRVQRPFRSRLTIFDGDDVRSDRAADFAYLAQGAADDAAVVLTAAPEPAPGDVRADIVLADGDATATRTIAGRECRVHPLGASLLDGELVPPGDDGRAEACIDADGLVLEEVVFDGDAVATRWSATDVDTAPRFTEDDFRMDGEPVPADHGGGSLREVEPTSRSLGTFWELPEPPAGFTLEGRYAIVPPQAASTENEKTRAQVIAGVVDVFVRGVDVVVIDQGGTLGRVPPFGAHPHGELVQDVGELAATAESVVTATGGELRVLIPPGRYVRVYGTLAVDELVDLARTIRPVEGEGLEYVE